MSFYWFWGSYDPILCTLYSNTKILMCAQIMGSFSSFFRTLLCAYHNIFILVACRIIGLVGSIDIRWLLASIGIFWLLVSLFVMSLWHIFLLQSLGINIVCLPPSIGSWVCVLHSTLLLRNTQFMEDHNLYWPSKIFAHFGNRCQWGRSFREFYGVPLVFVSLAFASHTHALLVGELNGDA